jgi:pyrimidine-nucleoside phosphorylase
MNPIDIIIKKRDGETLSADELQFLISGYVRDAIPDYQIAAFLMSVYFRGMMPAEIATLTQIMRDSGTVLDLSDIAGFKIDKHSTGGVGDKVSLILAPLVAAAGLIVPMISGRSLGHTGGTLDKLEAIPGFKTNLGIPEIKRLLETIGVALVGQTADLTPADKKIYALRDATGTVQAIPLITASILSKKMAEGIDALVLDVKAGSGAIFETKEKAEELARMLVATASQFNLKTVAVITSMDQPLGNAIGNWLETREAIETLRGDGPADLGEVTLTLGGQMLVMGGDAANLETGKKTLQKKIDDGSGFAKFLEIVKAQGGDTSVIEHPEKYPSAKFSFEIKSPKAGFVSEIHCREIGKISMALGAGRTAVNDGVDYTSGILLHKKVGNAVEAGEILAIAHTNKKERFEENKTRLQSVFKISDKPTQPPSLIQGWIDGSEGKGVQ